MSVVKSALTSFGKRKLNIIMNYHNKQIRDNTMVRKHGGKVDIPDVFSGSDFPVYKDDR